MPRERSTGIGQGGKTLEELAKEFEDVVVLRLERLEETNRRMRQLVLGLAGAVAVLLVGSIIFLAQLYGDGLPPWSASQVTARQFMLMGADGGVRGQWGVMPDGSTRMILNDATGVARLRITVLDNGGAPGISLSDGQGSTRAALAVLPDETSSLVFADRTGRTRAVFGISANDAANLVFADQTGVTRAGMGVDRWGEPNLTIAEGAAPPEPAAPSEAGEAEDGASARLPASP